MNGLLKHVVPFLLYCCCLPSEDAYVDRVDRWVEGLRAWERGFHLAAMFRVGRFRLLKLVVCDVDIVRDRLK